VSELSRLTWLTYTLLECTLLAFTLLLSHNDYNIACIRPMCVELAAIEGMLDEGVVNDALSKRDIALQPLHTVAMKWSLR
jgi:hypothetical protein